MARKQRADERAQHTEWFCECPKCEKEQRLVLALIVGPKKRKVPMCAVCRDILPDEAKRYKR